MNRTCAAQRPSTTRLGTALALWLATAPTGADEQNGTDAQRLHRTGAILSLEQVIQQAVARYPGRAIDARLHYEAHHGHYVYEILILDREGQVRELEYEAHTGNLLEHHIEDD